MIQVQYLQIMHNRFTRLLPSLATLFFITSTLSAARYEATAHTFPVLTDGEPARVLEFTLHTDKARTLTAVNKEIK